MTKEEKEKRAQEKIESAKKHVAVALNRLEAASEDLEYAFELQTDWNNMLTFDVSEASAKIGYTLATLTNWNDD